MKPYLRHRAIPEQPTFQSDGNRHSKYEQEGGKHHVDIRHHVDPGGSVIVPPGKTLDLCQLIDKDHENHRKSAKDIDGCDAWGMDQHFHAGRGKFNRRVHGVSVETGTSW